MATISWTLRANRDLGDLYDFIARSSPVSAAKVASDLYEAVQPLADFPLLGRTVPEFPDLGVREVVVPPFRVIYRILEGEMVEITAIYRSSQDLRRHLSELTT